MPGKVRRNPHVGRSTASVTGAHAIWSIERRRWGGPDIVAAGTLRTSSMVVELSGRLASLRGRRMLSRDFQLRRLNSSSCPESRGRPSMQTGQ